MGEKMKEVKDQETGFVFEYEGRSDLVTTLIGMFFYPEQIRNLHRQGFLSFDERVDALAKHDKWKNTQQKITGFLNREEKENK